MRLSFIFSLLLVSSLAHADGGRLGIVDLRVELDQDEEAQARATVEGAVRRVGLELVPDVEVQHMRSTAPASFLCFVEDHCRVDVGQRLQAGYLLTGSIGKEDGAYVVQLDVFDVQLATVGKRESAACPRCSPQAFEKRLATAVESAIRAARQLPRGQLNVRTQPPGADVKIDQRLVGTSNLEVVVAAGLHTVELSAEGRLPVTLTVDVKAKERRDVDAKMPVGSPGQPVVSVPIAPPQPPQLPPQPPQPLHESWWNAQRIAGVTLMAGGAVLALSSIAPFVLDSGCSSEGHCLFQHHTKAAGDGLAIVGAAVAVTGLVLVLTTPRKGAQPTQAAVMPFAGPRGGGVVGVVRF